MSTGADQPSDLITQIEGIDLLAPDELAAVKKIGTTEDAVAIQAALTQEGVGDSEDLRTLLASATVPERIKYGLFGNATVRSILIRDANRIVLQCVLKNPRLSPTEVEEFVKNSQISDFVLRELSNSNKWMKSYSMKYLMTVNPRTPSDIALKWLRYLKESELKKIARSKQLPQLIATTAKKRLLDMGKGG